MEELSELLSNRDLKLISLLFTDTVGYRPLYIKEILWHFP